MVFLSYYSFWNNNKKVLAALRIFQVEHPPLLPDHCFQIYGLLLPSLHIALRWLDQILRKAAWFFFPFSSLPPSPAQFLPCNFRLYSLLSDWLLLKVAELLLWSPATLLSTTVSVFLLSSMYNLCLRKVRFFFLTPALSFPVGSLVSISKRVFLFPVVGKIIIQGAQQGGVRVLVAWATGSASFKEQLTCWRDPHKFTSYLAHLSATFTV